LAVILGVPQDGRFIDTLGCLDAAQLRLDLIPDDVRSPGRPLEQGRRYREISHVQTGVFFDRRVGGSVPLVGGGGIQGLGHGQSLIVEGSFFEALEQGVEEAVVRVQHGIGGDEQRQALVAGRFIDLPELPGPVSGILRDGHEALPGEDLLLSVREAGPVEVGNGSRVHRLRVQVVRLGEGAGSDGRPCGTRGGARRAGRRAGGDRAGRIRRGGVGRRLAATGRRQTHAQQQHDADDETAFSDKTPFHDFPLASSSCFEPDGRRLCAPLSCHFRFARSRACHSRVTIVSRPRLPGFTVRDRFVTQTAPVERP